MLYGCSTRYLHRQTVPVTTLREGCSQARGRQRSPMSAAHLHLERNLLSDQMSAFAVQLHAERVDIALSRVAVAGGIFYAKSVADSETISEAHVNNAIQVG
jgi:hypothetical protein